MPTHLFEHYIPYADSDQMGYVYYANYLVYFEMARCAMLRDLGLPYSRLEAMGCLIPVLEAHVNYKKPARFDDLISIRTTWHPFEKLRFTITYTVQRANDLLATGHTRHVCIAPDGRPRRPAPELVRLLDDARTP